MYSSTSVPSAAGIPVSADPSILVVDDEASVRDILVDFLSLEGFAVEAVTCGAEALSALAAKSYALVLTDFKMPGINGLELLEILKRDYPAMQVILMTGYGTIESAIESMKKGAYDYVLKPFKMTELVVTLRRAIEARQLQIENSELKELVSLHGASERMTGMLHTTAILGVLFEWAEQETKADRCEIYLLNHSEVFECLMSRGESLRTVQLSVARVVELLEQREPVLSSDPAQSPLLVNGAAIRSFLAVPFFVRAKLFGFMALYGIRPGCLFDERRRKILSILADRVAQGLENARLYEGLERTFHETIKSFAIALEHKDQYTQGHSERVANYARSTAIAMLLPGKDVETIFHAALLHDIGKLGIDTDKINKPGKLNEDEVAMFRKHPTFGKRIVEPISSLAPLVSIIYHHHEKFDGSGYPDKLVGDQIPLGARILAVVDAFDAMTSTRSYRKAMTPTEAMAELVRYRGTQFDPVVVDAFVSLCPQLIEEAHAPT